MLKKVNDNLSYLDCSFHGHKADGDDYTPSLTRMKRY